MTNKQMRDQINKTAKSVIKKADKVLPKNTKLVDINWGLPYVAINLPNGEEYFFQGEEASNLLEEATEIGNKFEVQIGYALLHMSQGW